MALVTEQFCQLDDPATPLPEDFTFWVTYESTDAQRLLQGCRIKNAGTIAVYIRVYLPGNPNHILEYISQPGTDVTFTPKRAERPSLDAYSIGCGAV